MRFVNIAFRGHLFLKCNIIRTNTLKSFFVTWQLDLLHFVILGDTCILSFAHINSFFMVQGWCLLFMIG